MNRFLFRPRPEKQRFFALDLIAAKPVKPCDRGVFEALNLLLISERSSGRAGGAAQPKPEARSPKPDWLSEAFPFALFVR